MRHSFAGTITAVLVLAVTGAFAYEPRINYQVQCMGCHHADGAGEPGRVPSVRRTLVPFSAIPEGRNYVIRVPGVSQSSLGDADLAALLNWMARNLSDVEAGASFRDYTPAEVASVRHDPLVATKVIRQDLLERTPGGT